MSMSMLAQTQQLLWKLITAPEGAAAGIAALNPADRSVAEALVRTGGQLSPIERLDVYADMYFYRLRDCLQEDFPAVSAVIGDAQFHNLITDYLIAHPPSHVSLRYAGRDLPAFIGTHEVTARWPYAHQLAALEWAIVDAFDAPDASPVERTVVQAVLPEQWPELRFDLTPSMQRLHVDWRVDEVLRCVQDGTVPGAPDAAPTWLRVWRQDLRVFHRPIDLAEAVALAAVLNGEPFAALCAQVGELIGESAGAARVAQLLDTWFADGLITGCRE